MAHESHYSGQFLLGANPLMQGLEVEDSSGLLGIEMLEAPSSKLIESSNTAAIAWLPPEYSSSSSPMSLFEGSKQTSMKVSLSVLNTKPPSSLQPEVIHHHQQQQQQLFDLKNSIYLRASRELLIECCSLEGGSSSEERLKRTGHWELERPPTAFYSMNHLDFHSLKIKLFSMLEEVEKRYRRYCEQMRTTALVLESAAGEGAAEVYTTLASKAMSRHFRRLKDGIVGQLKAVKKAMGEIKEDYGGGPAMAMTRGDTPRLRLLDQCVRRQKALQQGMTHQQLPWRPQRGLPEHAVSILRAWLFEHFLHPYPSDADKIILARQTGLSRSQVSNWFINARVRIWKPMVEEMFMEEMKELDINAGQSSKPKPSAHGTDQKPPSSLPAQLLNADSGSLPSIVIHGGDESSFLLHRAAAPDNAGVVDFDFSTAYSNFAGDSLRRSSVSLTLGLRQQHGGGGIPTLHHRLFLDGRGTDVSLLH